MNCTFLENEFFYDTQLTSQGEKEMNIDSISWLPMPNNCSPTEGQNEPATSVAEHATDTQQPVGLGDTPTTSQPISEVNNLENFVIVDINNITAAEREEREIIDQDTGQYILPPRSTRGIPPKRYSPEQTSRQAKYPVGSVAKANLSKLARAFEATLYGEE